jgi:Capsule polysaccharide biosynthesis protein
VRFLFTTLQTYESDFYGRVGEELERRGHESAHITVSRSSAQRLRANGAVAECLHDRIRRLPEPSVASEIARIEATYEVPSIRDIYRADSACEGKDEVWCLRRTVLHVQALEQLVDELRPDVIVPEVGNETIRVVTHLIGLQRGIPVLFLFYTIFPSPLRLYVDTMHAPIVPPEELRALDGDELRELEEFRRSFIERARPIRMHRRVSFAPRRVGVLAGHLRRRIGPDRDNDYLRPGRLVALNASEYLRARLARPFYDQLGSARPYVYFPLHVTDDYKIKRVIPHCIDQASLVEQVADALPAGYDLVLKEHPMSIGRNSVALLRRLRKRRNVRLVEPHANTHDLIRASAAVAVISSTVGLEALLYEKPVLTLGQPFYGGYGITLDVDSFAEIREAVPALLRFRPDPEQIRRFLHAAMRACRPGAPVLVDRSDENARSLAASLEAAARELATV